MGVAGGGGVAGAGGVAGGGGVVGEAVTLVGESSDPGGETVDTTQVVGCLCRGRVRLRFADGGYQ